MLTLIQGDNLQAVEAVRERGGADLVVADPDWPYDNTGGTAGGKFRGASRPKYGDSPMEDIFATLALAYEVAKPDTYLWLWCTHPQQEEVLYQSRRRYLDARGAGRGAWRYLGGGSWHKTGSMGVGFHQRGDAEVWCLYAKGNPRPQHRSFRNAYAGPKGRHSEKPVELMRKALDAFCVPGGLVLSLWSGTCPEGQAALATGRRCVAAEANEERYEDTLRRFQALYREGAA